MVRCDESSENSDDERPQSHGDQQASAVRKKIAQEKIRLDMATDAPCVQASSSIGAEDAPGNVTQEETVLDEVKLHRRILSKCYSLRRSCWMYVKNIHLIQ